MLSKDILTNSMFTRKSVCPSGRYGFETIKKQNININNIDLISCTDTKMNDNETNKQKGVHFFVSDDRFIGTYKNPDRTLSKYGQYAFILSPDFSLYGEMNEWRKIESVAMNRWVGSYWQSKGLTVIPTVSWSNTISYDYCFDGVERGSIVAIGMIGCKKNKREFLRGYYEMINRLQPELIICFGPKYDEMKGNIITVDYMKSRKVVR